MKESRARLDTFHMVTLHLFYDIYDPSFSQVQGEQMEQISSHLHWKF